MAGTRAAWITTEQTGEGLLSRTSTGRGMRRRGYEYELHPSQIKRLSTGCVAVIAPGSGQAPTIARICNPMPAIRAHRTTRR
ncbi:MAG TPA: hypothetical protein VEJ23_01090 [Solirubrobacteraceae bacterium]|nr:hypothetical protein [Solirubrobacteraceae bacterium]